MTVVALIGKTCSGKSTLANELVKRGFATVISHTTRPQRPGEINGRDYHFITMDEFQSLEAKEAFIETNYFGDNYYGKSIGSMTTALGRAKHVASVLCPVGATNMRRYCEELSIPFIAVWLGVTEQQQVERLAARNAQLHSDEVQARLKAINDIESFWPPGFLELDMSLKSCSATPETLADLIVGRLDDPEEEDSHGL